MVKRMVWMISMALALMAIITGIIGYGVSRNGYWTQRNEIRIDWSDPWFRGDDVLYYGEIRNDDDTVMTRWCSKETWNLIMEAREKGLNVTPLP